MHGLYGQKVCTDMSFRCTVCYGQGDERRRYMGRSKEEILSFTEKEGAVSQRAAESR